MADTLEDIIAQLGQATADGGPTPMREAGEEPPPMLEAAGAAAPRSATPIAQPAIDMLLAAEVSSPAVYAAKYTHPIWPKGNSGVTIGIGYDIGTVSPQELAEDWIDELGASVVQQLAQACGVRGLAAAGLAARLQAVAIPFDQANRVFLHASVPKFVAGTERALPNTALLGPECLGALVSLAYNRGIPAFNLPDDRFREMRAIRDHMADRAFQSIPAELRSMKRIWAGNPDLRGVVLRREAEALLFERGLAHLPDRSGHPETPAAFHAEGREEGVQRGPALEGVFSTISGWLRPIIEEPTRDQLMFELPPAPSPGDATIRIDEDYVALRVLSARIVNQRRWTSVYHGAVHATCNMSYEGAGSARSERQSVLAPDGFRDIDPKGQGKLLQVDRPLFGPMPYRGDLRLSIALFSVKSSDLAGPYLSLISELSQTASLGFLSAAQPFIAPISKAADLLFGTSDAASLECGTVRGFEPLHGATWVCIGATRADVPDSSGYRLDPADYRLLDGAGHPVTAFPYLVFQVRKLAQRDDWMEVPAIKAAWDELNAALRKAQPDEAWAAAASFRALCLSCGDFTTADAVRLATKAERKIEIVVGPRPGAAKPAAPEPNAPPPGAPRLESVSPSLRSLDLYGPAG